MFCTNCGSKLPDGAKFCNECGMRVAGTTEVEKKIIAPSEPNYSEIKPEIKPVEAPTKPSMVFDWSNVIEEPHKKVVNEVRSPWSSPDRFEEKEILSEMKPSTNRARTMNFIELIMAEKEAKQPEEPVPTKAPAYVAREEEPQAPSIRRAPLYEDIDQPYRSPFDTPSPAPVYEPVQPIQERGPVAPVYEPPVKPAYEPTAPVYEQPVEPSYEPAPPVYEQPVKPVYESPVEPAREPVAPAPVAEPAPAPEYDNYLDIGDSYVPRRGRKTDDYDEYLDDDEAIDYTKLGDEPEEDVEEDVYIESQPAEPAPKAEEPETYDEISEYEEELFADMDKSRKSTGMTIAAPAEKDSEIEALKRRLAELTGSDYEEPAPESIYETIEDYATEEAPAVPEDDELFEPVVQPEPVAEPVVEEPESDNIDDLIADFLNDDDDEPFEAEESFELPVQPEPEPVAEPEPKSDAEPAEAEAKETDALSIEELEKNLFGEDNAESETTKKIDKFYTLYHKNDEFQRLLDEEYKKLKTGGVQTADPVAPQEEPRRQIEDATIYQPLDKPLEELAREEVSVPRFEGASMVDTIAMPAVNPEQIAPTPAASPVIDNEPKKAASKVEPEDNEELSEVDYEEVDKGGTLLTVLAVIVALLLVVMLGVILVVYFAPDSGAAMWIDSIIENITSHFSDAGFNPGNLLS